MVSEFPELCPDMPLGITARSAVNPDIYLTSEAGVSGIHRGSWLLRPGTPRALRCVPS